MNEGFQNFNASNFDPNSLANLTSSVIMFTGVLDVSPSIQSYEDSMNLAMSEIFMHELKTCHRASDIVINGITFCERVEHKSGFMPIVNLNNDYLTIKNQGRGTALYQAVYEALIVAIKYRKDLEDQGIDVRTNICIITDGEDNSSSQQVIDEINRMVNDLRTNEAWANSFTIVMIGVGKAANFTDACVTMGLDPNKCLSQITASAKDIRAMMGVVSQSVSSSSNAAAVAF